MGEIEVTLDDALYLIAPYLILDGAVSIITQIAQPWYWLIPRAIRVILGFILVFWWELRGEKK